MADRESAASTLSPQERLVERYGTSPRSTRGRKLTAYLGALGVAAVLVAWIWWAGLEQPTAQFEARDLGWDRVDDRTLSVRFELTVAPGTAMSCAVQTLNAQYGIVGWTVVDIPPSEQRTRVFDQVVRTSETAVTGLLYRCWVT